MVDPRTMSPGSLMPPYPWLVEQSIDKSVTPSKIEAMQALGVPYPDGYAGYAVEDVEMQAQQIVDNLKSAGITVDRDKEIIALIAYLQRLGTDVKVDRTARAAK